jgi:hypothetical protein
MCSNNICNHSRMRSLTPTRKRAGAAVNLMAGADKTRQRYIFRAIPRNGMALFLPKMGFSPEFCPNFKISSSLVRLS